MWGMWDALVRDQRGLMGYQSHKEPQAAIGGTGPGQAALCKQSACLIHTVGHLEWEVSTG